MREMDRKKMDKLKLAELREKMIAVLNEMTLEERAAEYQYIKGVFVMFKVKVE